MLGEATQVERMRRLLDLPLRALSERAPAARPAPDLIAAWDVPDLAREVLAAHGLPIDVAFQADLQTSVEPELESAGRHFYRLGRWGQVWIVGAEMGTSQVTCLNVEHGNAPEAVFNSALPPFVMGVWRWSRVDEVIEMYDVAMYDALDLFAHEQRRLDPVAAASDLFGWDAVVEAY
jgi:hypothetical protein